MEDCQIDDEILTLDDVPEDVVAQEGLAGKKCATVGDDEGDHRPNIYSSNSR